MEQTSQSDEASVPVDLAASSTSPVSPDRPVQTGLDDAFLQLAEGLSGESLAAGYSKTQLGALSPISLAYIGDAVFELYVRSRLLIPAKRIRDYHKQVVAQVKAEQQSEYVDVLMPHLTSEELDMLRRGRNATTGRSRRAAAKHYQKATGFEALIGLLYLSDRHRMLSLLALLSI